MESFGPFQILQIIVGNKQNTPCFLFLSGSCTKFVATNMITRCNYRSLFFTTRQIRVYLKLSSIRTFRFLHISPGQVDLYYHQRLQCHVSLSHLIESSADYGRYPQSLSMLEDYVVESGSSRLYTVLGSVSNPGLVPCLILLLPRSQEQYLWHSIPDYAYIGSYGCMKHQK